MPEPSRQLLIAIVKGHGRVERIMEGFLEIGVGGATVIDAKGMGQIISTEMPIFSGFRSLFPASGEESYMVMSVIDDSYQADDTERISAHTSAVKVLVGERPVYKTEDAVAMLRDVCEGFKEKGTGVVFTLPVTNFFGPV